MHSLSNKRATDAAKVIFNKMGMKIGPNKLYKIRRFSNFENRDGVEISRSFFETMKTRRTIREFAAEKVDKEIIYNAVRAAGCAPSGANAQPWFFGAIFSQKIKKKKKNK